MIAGTSPLKTLFCSPLHACFSPRPWPSNKTCSRPPEVHLYMWNASAIIIYQNHKCKIRPKILLSSESYLPKMQFKLGAFVYKFAHVLPPSSVMGPIMQLADNLRARKHGFVSWHAWTPTRVFCFGSLPESMEHDKMSNESEMRNYRLSLHCKYFFFFVNMIIL